MNLAYFQLQRSRSWFNCRGIMKVESPNRTQYIFGLHYAALFSGVGIVLPHFPRWLEGQGLTAIQLSMILAIGFVGKIIVGPIFSVFADRTGSRKIWLLILCIGYFIAVLSLNWIAGFILIFLIWGIGGSLATTQIPMSDSISVLAVKDRGLDYGLARLWGSMSFIMVSLAAGWYLEGKHLDVIIQLLAICAGFAVVVTFLLPDLRTDKSDKGRLSLLDAFRIEDFRKFLLIAGLIQASHAALYVFASVHWEKAGYGAQEISILWAESVVIEVLVFAFGRKLLMRLGILGLLSLSVAGGIVRWLVMGLTTDYSMLLAIQTLHAFTFATTHLAVVSYIAQHIPNKLSASAQGLYDMLSNGLIFGVAMILAGLIYDEYQGMTFWLMASMVAVSGVMLIMNRHRFRSQENQAQG